MSELADMLRALDVFGDERAILLDPGSAHLVADGHQLLSWKGIPGIHLEAEETPGAIVAELTVERGTHCLSPVHLCFGMLQPTGTQRIELRVTLEDKAQARVLAHCLFNDAQRSEHSMDATITVGAGADLRLSEGHYHGPYGGIRVLPTAEIIVGPGGRFLSDFVLTDGRVGRLEIDYRVQVEAEGVAEIVSRVLARGNDVVRIRDEVALVGENARGLVKTRVALEDEASADVVNLTEGRAKGARGHIDCREIVRNQAIARATPIVKVNHPQARVTHEAAIGGVDREQLETLMAHGLSPEEAVDTIVRGILR